MGCHGIEDWISKCWGFRQKKRDSQDAIARSSPAGLVHFLCEPGTPSPTSSLWLSINWMMIQNLYMGNGCLTKHPLKTGCLEFQEYLKL